MKKTIPIAIRKILEELAQNNTDIFHTTFAEGSVISFNDSDKTTDFKFQLEKINVNNNSTSYTLSYKPSNEENLNPYKGTVELRHIKTHFDKWIKLMIEINKESPLFDDQITQSYYDELEPNFDIVDKDAHLKTFSIGQQKMIVQFLNTALSIIEEKDIDPKEKKDVTDLISKTKNEISKSNKKKVIKNIRTILAKGFKIGLEVGERLLIEFTTELAKKLMLGSSQ
jgi:hypothetical protein